MHVIQFDVTGLMEKIKEVQRRNDRWEFSPSEVILYYTNPHRVAVQCLRDTWEKLEFHKLIRQYLHPVLFEYGAHVNDIVRTEWVVEDLLLNIYLDKDKHMKELHVNFAEDGAIERLIKSVYEHNDMDIQDIPVTIPTELIELSDSVCELLFIADVNELTDEQREVRMEWLKYFDDHEIEYSKIERIFFTDEGYFYFTLNEGEED